MNGSPQSDAKTEWLRSQIELACKAEASIEKPGNVTPRRSFADLTYGDFLTAAEAVAPPLAKTRVETVGASILDAVRAMRASTGTNVNLGIVLLDAPLVATYHEYGRLDPASVGGVLSRLSERDAVAVYAAIRELGPGGLGDAAEGDVADDPTGTLTEMMKLAADRDLVAAQYDSRNPYPVVFDFAESMTRAEDEATLVRCFVGGLATHGDTLVQRKLGSAAEAELRRRAAEAMATGDLVSFDVWLRADGHRRNPGAMADLFAAGILVHLLTDGSRRELFESLVRQADDQRPSC